MTNQVFIMFQFELAHLWDFTLIFVSRAENMTTIDVQELEHMLHAYEGYKNRHKPLYTPEQLSSLGQSELLDKLTKQTAEETYLLDKILDQAQHFYRSLYQEIVELKDSKEKVIEKLKACESELEGCRDQIISLTKEKQQMIDNQASHQDDAEAITMKAQQMERNYLEQIKELKEEVERQEIKIKNITDRTLELQEQNSNLNKFIMLHKEEETQHINRINLLEKEKEVMEKELQKFTDQIDWEHKKRQNLEQQLQEKQRQSVSLTEEVESLKQILKHPFDQFDYQLEDLVPFQKNISIEDVNKQKVLLSEDIGQGGSFVGRKISDERLKKEQADKAINEPTENGNVQLVNKSLKNLYKLESSCALVKKKSKGKKITIVDPYYCHFLLLSQSAKIRENKEEYFNLDIKPHYFDMITEKVPMHKWTQWIVKKFEQLSLDEQQKKGSMEIEVMANGQTKE